MLLAIGCWQLITENLIKPYYNYSLQKENLKRMILDDL